MAARNLWLPCHHKHAKARQKGLWNQILSFALNVKWSKGNTGFTWENEKDEKFVNGLRLRTNLAIFKGWDEHNILGCNCSPRVKTQEETAEKLRISYQQSNRNLLSPDWNFYVIDYNLSWQRIQDDARKTSRQKICEAQKPKSTQAAHGTTHAVAMPTKTMLFCTVQATHSPCGFINIIPTPNT